MEMHVCVADVKPVLTLHSSATRALQLRLLLAKVPATRILGHSLDLGVDFSGI